MRNISWNDFKKEVSGPIQILSVGFVDDPDSIYREELKSCKTGRYKIVEHLETGRVYRVWEV